MKQTYSVNLGNQVYNIDDDAYLKLKAYLDNIEGYFSDEKEREDIINDIETRIGELFAERLSPVKQVITLRDVEEIITVMGDPGVISGGRQKTYSRYESRTTTRRIYRDPDNRIIGGVCGGLGAYFNFDPVIMRVLLVVLFFAFGFGLLLYLILWIVIPEAKTTAQKLEMRGAQVNASNIGSFFREEFDSVKKTFTKKNHN